MDEATELLDVGGEASCLIDASLEVACCGVEPAGDVGAGDADERSGEGTFGVFVDEFCEIDDVAVDGDPCVVFCAVGTDFVHCEEAFGSALLLGHDFYVSLILTTKKRGNPFLWFSF